MPDEGEGRRRDGAAGGIGGIPLPPPRTASPRAAAARPRPRDQALGRRGRGPLSARASGGGRVVGGGRQGRRSRGRGGRRRRRGVEPPGGGGASVVGEGAPREPPLPPPPRTASARAAAAHRRLAPPRTPPSTSAPAFPHRPASVHLQPNRAEGAGEGRCGSAVRRWREQAWGRRRCGRRRRGDRECRDGNRCGRKEDESMVENGRDSPVPYTVYIPSVFGFPGKIR